MRKILRDEPEAISVRNAKVLTPLHVAASRGQHRVVKLLLDKGADVTGPSQRGEWPPLVYAAYRGHLEAVRVLLDAGAGANDKSGNPIHYAGQRGHKDICRLLVEFGAVDNLIRTKDPDVIALFRAAYSYDSNSVGEILSRRPRLVNRKDKNGRTALHEACTNGDRKTVKKLLEYGADAGIVDKQGHTPLDRAEAHRKRSVVKLLAGL